MCPVSDVRCHLSHITCQTLFLQSGEVSYLRVCYQKGLPRQVLRLLFKRVDIQYLHILASSGPFVVITKKQIDESLILDTLEYANTPKNGQLQ